MKIHSLELPSKLVDLLDSGSWSPPDSEIIEEVFGEKPVQTVFYDIETMRRENDAWQEEILTVYFGSPDLSHPPGDIDPSMSVLIGDLGPDLPIALDYRESILSPRVLFLGTRVIDRWIEISKSFEELCRRLHF
ncbi:MAG: hypothetical protein AAFY88_03600 [Acidobacteriota bacterium]